MNVNQLCEYHHASFAKTIKRALQKTISQSEMPI